MAAGKTWKVEGRVRCVEEKGVRHAASFEIDPKAIKMCGTLLRHISWAPKEHHDLALWPAMAADLAAQYPEALFCMLVGTEGTDTSQGLSLIPI